MMGGANCPKSAENFHTWAASHIPYVPTSNAAVSVDTAEIVVRVAVQFQFKRRKEHRCPHPPSGAAFAQQRLQRGTQPPNGPVSSVRQVTPRCDLPLNRWDNPPGFAVTTP